MERFEKVFYAPKEATGGTGKRRGEKRDVFGPQKLH